MPRVGWILRRPTVLLHVAPEEDAELEELELLGADSWALDLPTEISYHTAVAPTSVYDAPPPIAPCVKLLVAAHVLVEAEETLEQHDDARGILVFDRRVLEGGPSFGSYEATAAALSPRGFWIEKPESAACVAAIERSLSTVEREQAKKARERYPQQFREDTGWLVELRNIYGHILYQRYLGFA